jgi:hypothetical protein
MYFCFKLSLAILLVLTFGFYIGLVDCVFLSECALYLFAIFISPFISCLLMPITPIPYKLVQCAISFFFIVINRKDIAYKVMQCKMPFKFLQEEWDNFQEQKQLKQCS